MSWFFSFRGRINRASYWLGVVILLAISLAVVLLIILLLPQLALAIIPVGVVSLWVALALAVKRLHDRNKSGWWSVLFIVMPGALDRLTDRLPEESPAWWVIVLIAIALSAWGLIEMGFRKGTVGDNEHGPDPLERRA
jgi:uncharacterized membrane protein YhaH (DUF805 family)